MGQVVQRAITRYKLTDELRYQLTRGVGLRGGLLWHLASRLLGYA